METPSVLVQRPTVTDSAWDLGTGRRDAPGSVATDLLEDPRRRLQVRPDSLLRYGLEAVPGKTNTRVRKRDPSGLKGVSDSVLPVVPVE